jgi:hypothetical protein
MGCPSISENVRGFWGNPSRSGLVVESWYERVHDSAFCRVTFAVYGPSLHESVPGSGIPDSMAQFTGVQFPPLELVDGPPEPLVEPAIPPPIPEGFDDEVGPAGSPEQAPIVTAAREAKQNPKVKR